MQKLYGIDSVLNRGALGHQFYVNDLSQIILQVSILLTLRSN
jgi:hypothetical protein